VAVPLIASAQQARPLSVEDALKTYSFGETSPLSFSPDGRWIVYMVRNNQKAHANSDEEWYIRTGLHDGDCAGELWLSNTETGEQRKLTRDQGSNWDPAWSPDGRYVAFLSTQRENPQASVSVWDSSTNMVRIVSPMPIRAMYQGNEIQWTPDSRKILITAIPKELSVGQYVHKVLSSSASPGRLSLATDGSTAIVYEAQSNASSTLRTPDLFNSDAFYLHDLVLIDVASGAVQTVVHGHRIEEYWFSPDGQYVAYSIPAEALREGSHQRLYDLVILHLPTMRQNIVASGIPLHAFSWSPDSLFVTYVVDGSDEQDFEFYLVPAIGGSPITVAVVPYSPFADAQLRPLWLPDGKSFFFVLNGNAWSTSVSPARTVELPHIPDHRIQCLISKSPGLLWVLNGRRSIVVVAHDQERKQDGFYKIDLATSQSERLLENGECYTCKWPQPSSSHLTAVSADGQELAYISEDAQRAPDLWIATQTLQDGRRLTHLNPQFEKYQMGSAHLIDWLGDDGQHLHGALLLPPNYRRGHRCPLVVWVYGGAQLSNHLDQFGFGEFPGPFNLQLLATRGYAVFLPDSPTCKGQPMVCLAKSVLPGVNKVVDMGIADSDRVALMGHSGGGYGTLALIAQTNRFRVAVEADGFADFVGVYGTMNMNGVGYQFGQAEALLGSDLWRYPLRYVENSPIFVLDRVETPLLIVQGSQDSQVAAFLADEVFVDLRRLGKEVQYAKYQGEGHAPNLWSYPNQLNLAYRIIAWIDVHLKFDVR
jgi:dipeptidyl aminopeptidase/acylaminoacyl peptidase